MTQRPAGASRRASGGVWWCSQQWASETRARPPWWARSLEEYALWWLFSFWPCLFRSSLTGDYNLRFKTQRGITWCWPEILESIVKTITVLQSSFSSIDCLLYHFTKCFNSLSFIFIQIPNVRYICISNFFYMRSLRGFNDPPQSLAYYCLVTMWHCDMPVMTRHITSITALLSFNLSRSHT